MLAILYDGVLAAAPPRLRYQAEYHVGGQRIFYPCHRAFRQEEAGHGAEYFTQQRAQQSLVDYCAYSVQLTFERV